ncbi:tyrosine-type recombinase/integrase [Sodalis sp. RH20]|uniref:tyrosine-type recombinase/integrase n=1 Tax=unclassified Sodalis (in: enterobacteria) TaxID=2636512 RepID=UPI0039B5DBC4
MQKVEPVRRKEDIKTIEILLREGNSSPIYADIWIFLNQTGMRISDCLALEFSQFTGTALTLEVKEGKTKKYVDRPLTPAAIRVIEKRRALNPTHRYLFEVQSNRASGVSISRVTVAAKFKKAGDALGLHIGTHTPRKNLGYHGLKRGVSLPVLQKVYGHSSQAVTLAYCGIIDRDVEQVYEGIDY